jgi:hypothetical protein
LAGIALKQINSVSDRKPEKAKPRQVKKAANRDEKTPG